MLVLLQEKKQGKGFIKRMVINDYKGIYFRIVLCNRNYNLVKKLYINKIFIDNI